MKCMNCGVEAGNKGNKHVRNRSYNCTRRVVKRNTKRDWLGRTSTYEDYVVVESLTPSVVDWSSADELRFETPSSSYGSTYQAESHGSSNSSNSYSSDNSSPSSSYGSSDSSNSSGYSSDSGNY